LEPLPGFMIWRLFCSRSQAFILERAGRKPATVPTDPDSFGLEGAAENVRHEQDGAASL
jgi:hypothetical protein